jgi:hypothetical protein
MLGIKENNIALPDLHEAELKSHRSNSNNLITLFTFNNKVWKIPPLEAVKKYGSLDKNGRKGLYYTMSLKPNSAGLFLSVTDKDISVRHIAGEVIATWKLAKLSERFTQKIPAMIFVSAFTEERDGKEYFHFYRAQLLKDTSVKILYGQFMEDNIILDLRDNCKTINNEETGFRTNENKLYKLFSSVSDL